jgi:hypothetical protein
VRRASWSLVAALTLLATGCGAAGVESPSIAATPSSAAACANSAVPRAITRMSAVYITSRQNVVVFGGDDVANAPLAETWVRSGRCWSLQNPAASPSPRDSIAVAYDEARDVVVLYGGQTGGPGQPATFVYDTWIWDGTTWKQASTTGPRLVAPAAAYYPTSKQVVIFGSTSDGYAQTWAWDGVSWRQLQPAASPNGRLAPSLTFDVVTKRLLLFGGDQTLQTVGETWTWDGSTWQDMKPTSSPTPRFAAAMASYRSGNSVVLNGGLSRSKLYYDTWTWNGHTWTQQQPLHVPSSGGTIAVDTGSETLLIGGNGTVWSWSGSDWTLE